MTPFFAGGSSIAFALAWLDAALLDSIATTIAIIVVASLGFRMFMGCVDVRRATQVILGCFIVFGASTIATGIHAAASGSSGAPDPPFAQPLPPQVAYAAGPATAFDPYAGVALPQR